MRSPQKRVAAGVALLDKEGPKQWRKRIACDTLDLSDCKQCILGQVYGHYHDGLAGLALTLGSPYGFDRDAAVDAGAAIRQYKRLEAAWRQELDC